MAIRGSSKSKDGWLLSCVEQRSGYGAWGDFLQVGWKPGWRRELLTEWRAQRRRKRRRRLLLLFSEARNFKSRAIRVADLGLGHSYSIWQAALHVPVQRVVDYGARDDWSILTFHLFMSCTQHLISISIQILASTLCCICYRLLIKVANSQTSCGLE